MDNPNFENNNGEGKSSIFEQDVEHLETPTVNKPEENVVTPVVEKRDIADKTIDAVENFIDTKDHKDEYNAEEVKKYKKAAIISYIPIVSLYYVVTNKYKESNYLKFHVCQGLSITITYVIIFFIDKILTSIFSSNSLVLNSTPGIISFIIYALYFIMLLAMFFGIINTANGLSKEIPIIGKIKLLK